MEAISMAEGAGELAAGRSIPVAAALERAA